MGYTDSNGRWIDTKDVVLLPAAVKTATFNGAAIELGDRTDARLLLDVTAGSGTTPTLDVVVETGPSATGPWRSVGTFTQATGVTSERKSVSGIDRFVRGKATIGGTTPSFTFSLKGEAL